MMIEALVWFMILSSETSNEWYVEEHGPYRTRQEAVRFMEHYTKIGVTSPMQIRSEPIKPNASWAVRHRTKVWGRDATGRWRIIYQHDFDRLYMDATGLFWFNH